MDFERKAATETRRWIASFALFATVIAFIGGYWWRYSRRSGASVRAHVMMAVLPFENLTGDPNQEFVTDGLTVGQVDPRELGRHRAYFHYAVQAF